jgi:hypothetical protein
MTLEYYKKKEDKTPDAVIELGGGHCRPSPTDDTPDRFEVKGSNDKRIFYFLPRSQKEMKLWVEKINQRIEPEGRFSFDAESQLKNFDAAAAAPTAIKGVFQEAEAGHELQHDADEVKEAVDEARRKASEAAVQKAVAERKSSATPAAARKPSATPAAASAASVATGGPHCKSNDHIMEKDKTGRTGKPTCSFCNEKIEKLTEYYKCDCSTACTSCAKAKLGA